MIAYRNHHPLVLIFAIALMALPAAAQDTADLEARAAAAIQASDWDEALALYTELTQAKPENAQAWYRLGLATVKSGGDGADGRAAFAKAQELGFPAGATQFGIAKSHLMEGDAAAALETLEKLAEQGPAPIAAARLEADELFAPLISSESYEAVIKRLTPCMTDEYRQFDFWLGSWTVFSRQGQEVGANVITEALDGCALIENWTSVSGGKGMSINYYDRDAGKWSQVYRDNTGNVSQWPTLVGGLVDSAMVLDSGTDTNPRTRWKWSLEPDGRVRQMAESTSDGGETWTVVWDSYYQNVAE